MVVLADTVLDQIPLVRPPRPNASFNGVPVIDLCAPSSEAVVRACEEFGMFRVVNHGVPMELIKRLEAESMKFFSLPLIEKEMIEPANPFGYGNKRIGQNGDLGWVEYLLFMVTLNPLSYTSMVFLNEPCNASFRLALDEYLEAVSKVGSEVLELIAEGLKIEPRDTISKLVVSAKSDRIFRLNHYPKCPTLQAFNCSLTGFGEHTDPQIISILRSNSSSGLQICLKDGNWVAVQSEPQSFFINVGDALQVLTNDRFRSVKHRVVANGYKSRFSMIYFFGPSPEEKIAPLPDMIGNEKQSIYKEFTWSEYKQAAFKSRLADHRLGPFESTHKQGVNQ